MTIKVKSTKKNVSSSVKIVKDGQKIVNDFKTSCKTFGSFLHTPDGNLKGKCKTCAKKNAIAAESCFFVTNPKGFVVASRKSGKSTDRPWSFVVSELQSGKSRKSIVASCVSDHNMKENSAKSFVASCGCVINAMNGKSTKKDGIVSLYCNWITSDKKSAEPVGDKCSISYVKNVHAVM